MKQVFDFLIVIAIIFAVIALYIFIGSFIFMIVWNAFVPAVFGLPALDYIQALAGWFLIGIVGSAFSAVISKG